MFNRPEKIFYSVSRIGDDLWMMSIVTKNEILNKLIDAMEIFAL